MRATTLHLQTPLVARQVSHAIGRLLPCAPNHAALRAAVDAVCPYEDVERRVPDNRRATAVLGYTPSVRLEQGLPKTIAWQRAVMAREGSLP